MKNSTIVLIAFSFFAGNVIESCNTPAQKVENAQENVKDAKDELNTATEEYISDIENYRIETANKIEANNKSIAEFKARKELDKKEAKEEYKMKISELEKKNTDMKKKMDDYQINGKENWEIFKTEFNRDMDELGSAFKDLTVKNVK